MVLLMIDSKTLGEVIISFRGVFLVVLIFSASYLSPYMGCNIQSILKKNTGLKHLLLFLIIFFTISLVSPLNDTVNNPFIELLKSIIVYVVFILLNGLHSYSVLLVIALFGLLVFITNIHFYYKDVVKDKRKYKYIEDFMFIVEICLLIGIFIIILLNIARHVGDNSSLNTIKRLFLLKSCKQNKIS